MRLTLEADEEGGKEVRRRFLEVEEMEVEDGDDEEQKREVEEEEEVEEEKHRLLWLRLLISRAASTAVSHSFRLPDGHERISDSLYRNSCLSSRRRSDGSVCSCSCI